MLPSGKLTKKFDEDIAIIRTKTHWLWVAIGLIFLLTIPLYAPADWLTWLILLNVTIIAVLGLHILVGMCGQVSLGHAAFVAIGAYATAIFTSRIGGWWSSWVSLPLSGLTAGLVGVIFGAPSLRIKGFYLALSTIAAQFIIIWLLSLRSLDTWTGGVAGMDAGRLKVGSTILSDTYFYFVAMFLMLLMLVFTKNIQRTNTGRAFIAIRDRDIVAEVAGVNLFRYKLIAFFIGCFYAGIAGWLWAHYFGWITPDQFTFQDSIWYLGMIIVGGAGSTVGVLFGCSVIEGLDKMVDYLKPIINDAFPALGKQFSASAALIFFAVVIIVFLIFEPRGLAHRWEIIKSRSRTYPYGSP